MTDKINYGGPAYPAPETSKELYGIASAYPGMTLRDHFAGLAMPLGWKVFDEGYSPDECSPDNIAKFAYEVADAMLRAREGKRMASLPDPNGGQHD